MNQCLIRRKNIPRGVPAALTSAFFLGLAPVFGKQAIQSGFSPLFVVAARTFLATMLLLAIMALFKRKYFYIFPLGLVGCFLAGAINGLGSLLYYVALGHLSASVGQLLYSLYPLFVAFWLLLDHQPPSRLTLFRMGLAGIAVIFLTYREATRIDLIGIIFMLGAAALYALHIPINQRVLFEIPAPTVTLYTLVAMSGIVVPAFFLFDIPAIPSNGAWWPLMGLTLVTFLSRITLFMGVKHLGGMQTALLGLAELFITLGLSYFMLNERLSSLQWIGAAILGLVMLLIIYDRPARTRKPNDKEGWLRWLRPPTTSKIPLGLLDQ